MDETSADDGTTQVTSINKPTTSDTFEVKYGTLTDPADDTNHVYRYRATKIQGSQSVSIHCDLYQGTTLIRADSAHTLTTGTWETFTVSLTTGEASGITDYGDVRLRCIPETGGGGGQPAVAAVTWTEFEIPDASGNPPISVSDTWSFTESTDTINHKIRSGTDTWTFIESTDVSGMFTRSGTDVWTFIESTDVNEGGGGGYTPSGKYIWFICNSPSTNVKGCVFAFDCGAGNYVRGINENGTLICEALPP